MTREEQKKIREREKLLKKAMENACREIGKRRGWKTVRGHQYRVRDNLLDVLIVMPSAFDSQILKANFYCKPPALDEMYWKVFHMAEEAAEQPFSFHVWGAFTARGLWLPAWQERLSGPEDPESAVEAVFDRAEALAAENTFPDLAAYRARLEAEERPKVLEIILRLLCEENYLRAMALIEENLARGESGGFSREGGRRSILEDARDYCAARLAQRISEGDAP